MTTTTADVAPTLALGDARDACCAADWIDEARAVDGRSGRVAWRDDGRHVWGEIDVEPGSHGLDDALEAATRAAYLDIFAALRACGAPHVLRLWNRVPRINEIDPRDGLERYRQFNVGRQQAFIDAGHDAFEGAPAACAVGTPDGPLSIRFVATRQPAWPIENPRQVSAYRYSTAYGPRAPTFSRAALGDGGPGRVVLCISGTASIVGEHSLHAGDVRAQLAETLRNLDAVLDRARARCTARLAPSGFDWVVYLRHAADWDRVRDAFGAWAGGANVRALQADICRRELLIEIEGHAFAAGARVR